MNLQINLRRIFVLTGITSLALLYIILYVRMMNTPIENTGADFAAFHAAGRIANAEGPGKIYDLRLQEKYQEEMVGFDIASEQIRPFIHPPFVAPIAQLVSSKNYLLSFALWDLVMLAILGLGAIPFMKLLQGQLNPSETREVLAGVLLFFPAFQSLLIGQDSAIAYLGLGLWMFGLLTGRDRLAGLGLVGMTVRPHFALMLALPFLFKRRGVFAWFVVGALALVLVSLAYTGPEGIEGFLRVLLVSGSGENYSTGEDNMINLIGLLRRVLPGLPVPSMRLAGWGVYFATLIGLCVFWAKRGEIGEKELSLAVILVLFTSPHTHLQDMLFLIVPVIAVIRLFTRGTQPEVRGLVLLPLGMSLINLVSFSSRLFLISVPYLLMAGLLVFLWFPHTIRFLARHREPGW